MQRRKWLIARRIVQCASVLVFLAPLLLCGWSLFGLTVPTDDAILTPSELFFYGSLSSSQVFGLTLLDPFAFLQVTFASKSLDVQWLLFVLPVLVVYGVIGARVFCGWICPVNLLLEGVDFLRKKLGIKVRERALPRRTKIGMLLGTLLLSAVLCVPVFELVSPIGAINKGMLFGSLAGLLTLVAMVILELFWGHRVWCRALCPLGGLYQLLGRLGLVKVVINSKACTKCNHCKEVCLASPEILDPCISAKTTSVRAGDCMRCGLCVDVCPAKALSIKIKP